MEAQHFHGDFRVLECCFHGTFIETQQCFLEISMETQCLHKGFGVFPWCFLALPGFHGKFNGASMGLAWNFHRITTATLMGTSHGTSMGLPYFFHGNTAVLPYGFPWCFHAMAFMRLPWKHSASKETFIVFPCDSIRVSWKPLFPRDNSGDFHARTVHASMGTSMGTSMVGLPWHMHGNSIMPPMEFHSASMVTIAASRV